MEMFDSMAAAGAVGLIVAALVFLFWLAIIISYFSMAINISRLRQEVKTLRELAVAQHHRRSTEAHSQQVVQQPPAPGPQNPPAI